LHRAETQDKVYGLFQISIKTNFPPDSGIIPILEIPAAADSGNGRRPDARAFFLPGHPHRFAGFP